MARGDARQRVPALGRALSGPFGDLSEGPGTQNFFKQHVPSSSLCYFLGS